jgi:septum site-determining protein MinC
MTHPKVQIKGIREGLLVLPSEGSWEDVHAAIIVQIDEQAEFLKGGRLAIDLGNHVLKAAEMGKLRDEISERGLVLWAVLSNSPTTESTAQALGLATRLNKPSAESSTHPIETTLRGGESAVIIRRTLRSGYSFQYSGHVVVLGDVNPGAEIIASGDVIVWGHLRGMVHAGAEGNDDAVVCALDLAPIQLRIGGLIATTPQHRGKPQPELARVQDGQVVAETWNPKRK